MPSARQRVLRHAREHPLQQQREVRLVERRGCADEIAEVLRGALAVAHEVIAGGGVLPAAERREPAGRREVPEGHHRREPVLVARRQHAAVVVELGPRVDALLRLDARPLDREPERVEAERGGQRDVVRDSDGRSRRRRRRARRTSTASCARAPSTSLLMLLPSTWCAAVAAPQRNPFGKDPAALRRAFRSCGQRSRGDRQAGCGQSMREECAARQLVVRRRCHGASFTKAQAERRRAYVRCIGDASRVTARRTPSSRGTGGTAPRRSRRRRVDARP